MHGNLYGRLHASTFSAAALAWVLISAAIGANKTNEKLELNHNNLASLSKEAWQHFATAIQRNTSITYLGLLHNSLGNVESATLLRLGRIFVTAPG